MDDRYILQQSKNLGYWVCTDKLNGLVCTFEEKAFNDNQKFTFLEDIENPDPVKIARLCREMADWLMANHYDIIF